LRKEINRLPGQTIAGEIPLILSPAKIKPSKRL